MTTTWIASIVRKGQARLEQGATQRRVADLHRAAVQRHLLGDQGQSQP